MTDPGPMNRHEFLRRLHALTRPRNYLEVGVDQGLSMSLSRVPSIGVDPNPRIKTQQHCDLKLVRSTSDDFFARRDPIAHLRGGRNPLRNILRGRPPLGYWLGPKTIDLAFIDGMHLSEFALRDFMNIERLGHWASPIVFDDVFPRDIDEAARERHTSDWTGDVYKVAGVLRTYRPDLLMVPLDTVPTGVLVVLGADPSSQVLKERYARIVEELVVPDPQPVPVEILERHDAVAPEALLGARFWPDLVQARNRSTGRDSAYERVRAEVAALPRVGIGVMPPPEPVSPGAPGR